MGNAITAPAKAGSARWSWDTCGAQSPPGPGEPVLVGERCLGRVCRVGALGEWSLGHWTSGEAPGPEHSLWGGAARACVMFSGIPGLYPLDPTGTLPHQLWQSRTPPDITKHPLRSKAALSGELLVRARKMWTEIREAAAPVKPWATDVDDSLVSGPGQPYQ